MSVIVNVIILIVAILVAKDQLTKIIYKMSDK